ncbi:hypothetical protein GCM10026987_05300 [Belliella aquatica]|uniref:Uncharacterized protein n=1 Tax=Belliella aquatica TaxID=1323734 RepID=A0ABQ1MC84_9BACT|nr:hypothetical protein GCM10010993_16240 [Belliella aquatica]
MGKFIIIANNTICKQTSKIINKGEKCYYVPGYGYFHEDSDIYKNKLKSGGFRIGTVLVNN